MAKAPAKEHAKPVEPEHVKPVEPQAEKLAEKLADKIATDAKTDEAFLAAIHKPKESEKTVRLRVQKGTDEINHEGVSYKVSQGPATEEWTVEVPAHVAEHVLRQGGALQLDVPPPPIDQGEGFVTVRHVSGEKKTSFSHGVQAYESDEEGKIKVPVSILPDIEPHGFLPC